MSDLGELTVNVQAEGVEEAGRQIEETGDELADMDGAEVGTTDGDGDGLLAIIPPVKKMVPLLAGVFGILAVLQDTLKVVGSIMQAFIRPLSVALLRLFMPVLRLFLRLLPFWLEFVRDPSGSLQRVFRWLWDQQASRLPGLIWALTSQLAGLIWAEFETWADDVRSALRDIPRGVVGQAAGVGPRIPGTDVTLGAAALSPFARRGAMAGAVANRLLDELGIRDEENQPIRGAGGSPEVTVVLGGGLPALVEEIGRDRSIDLP